MKYFQSSKEIFTSVEYCVLALYISAQTTCRLPARKCLLFCAFGYVIDKNGCETCKCKSKLY